MTGADVNPLAALGGGVVSFLSPCVLPIVPAYLSVITGLDVAEVKEGDRRHLPRIAFHTGMFIAGFSAVFILLGLTATALGGTLTRNQDRLTRISGVLVVAMALYMLGSLVLRAPGLYQERRWHPNLSRFGPFAAPVAGVAFGLGWTPCIGPVLGAVLTQAAVADTAGRGAILLLFYSLGLGIPFMATGLAFGRLAGALNWVKRHSAAVTATSAVALGFFGVLLALNRFTWLTTHLQNGMDSLGLHRLLTLG
ncbi:MAG TPA: cytochrome c biogenesis protein CcdA [Acidimicrobiia bacterium]|nr:cytochrome c biogenesis protein CcdA [Acidimicrobiia bacterium]